MVVDAHGRAYVGNFGFDMYGGAEARETCIIARASPTGRVRVAADGLAFPNGTVITDDGRTLIVGESYGGRLTAFTIARRRHARRTGACSRSSTARCPTASASTPKARCGSRARSPAGVLRVQEGGEVLDEIKVANEFAYACMLGGDDRRTLFMCTAPSSDPKETLASTRRPHRDDRGRRPRRRPPVAPCQSSARRSQPAGGGARRQNCSGAGAASLAPIAQSSSSASSCVG